MRTVFIKNLNNITRSGEAPLPSVQQPELRLLQKFGKHSAGEEGQMIRCPNQLIASLNVAID